MKRLILPSLAISLTLATAAVAQVKITAQAESAGRAGHFWIGHAGKSVTDGYDRVREDVEYRKEVARSVGLGFTIPTVIVSRVRENEVETEKEIAVSI